MLGAIFSIGLLASWAVLIRVGDAIAVQQNGEAVVDLDSESVEYLGFHIYITAAAVFVISVFYVIIAPFLIHGARTVSDESDS